MVCLLFQKCAKHSPTLVPLYLLYLLKMLDLDSVHIAEHQVVSKLSGLKP